MNIVRDVFLDSDFGIIHVLKVKSILQLYRLFLTEWEKKNKIELVRERRGRKL